MEVQFIDHIKKNNLFDNSHNLLLAYSAGVDSSVLFNLLLNCKYKFSVAHCNYKLRGQHSDNDQRFIIEKAKIHKVKYHTREFDISKINFKKSHSVQMKCRQLRYKWFNELSKKYGYDFILTAHHLNDSIETFFINIFRGTGIEGLTGIPIKRDKFIRPLLFATKNSILEYAKKNDVHYREDKSNENKNYKRNKIRSDLIPIISVISKNYEEIFYKSFKNLKNLSDTYKYLVKLEIQKIMTKEFDLVYLNLSKIKDLKEDNLIVYEAIKEYGFKNSLKNIIRAYLQKKSGKLFYSKHYKLLVDRGKLIINKINKDQYFEPMKIYRKDLQIDYPIKINFSTSDKMSITDDPFSESFDFDKLRFPLILRNWHKGDKFIPLGMKSFKKLSDFFIDEKISISEKDTTWLLFSESNLVWIIGKRIDDRFKVTSKTKKMYIATVNSI